MNCGLLRVIDYQETRAAVSCTTQVLSFEEKMSIRSFSRMHDVKHESSVSLVVMCFSWPFEAVINLCRECLRKTVFTAGSALPTASHAIDLVFNRFPTAATKLILASRREPCDAWSAMLGMAGELHSITVPAVSVLFFTANGVRSFRVFLRRPVHTQDCFRIMREAEGFGTSWNRGDRIALGAQRPR